MNQRIENGYLITEYENGTVVKSLLSEDIVIPNNEIPINPIIKLQEENASIMYALMMGGLI